MIRTVGTAPVGGYPVLYLAGGPELKNEVDALLSGVEPAQRKGLCRPFLLAGLVCPEWNRSYSPWPAPGLRAKEAFAGGGPKTLCGPLTELVEQVERDCPVAVGRPHRALLGYSLAGLFALWAFYESGSFAAVGSCSGSLWFDGWLDYQRSRCAPQGSRVYLSLGRAEERARNRRMAAVGDVTREAAALLEMDTAVQESTLVWHEGGHFCEIPKRLAQAAVWLMGVQRSPRPNPS